MEHFLYIQALSFIFNSVTLLTWLLKLLETSGNYSVNIKQFCSVISLILFYICLYSLYFAFFLNVLPRDEHKLAHKPKLGHELGL